MKIAIIGTGHIGSALGRGWSAKGHEITLGSRDPVGEKAQKLATECNGQAMDIGTAASAGDVIVLAVPWMAAEETIQQCGDLSGKVLVDCINPLNAQFNGLDLGFTTSGAEQIAQWASGARVVKAFNTVSEATMIDPIYDGQPATMFYCGDDDEANSVVDQLASDIGLQGVDAGPLEVARQLEPFAMLYIFLAIKKGWGSNCAFKIMHRPKPT